MRAPYIVAFDVGTSGVKAVLTDASHRVVASHSRPYGITTLPDGWVDQDLDPILGAVEAASGELLAASGVAREQVDGIGVTAQMFNLVAVDRDGRSLAPMISWLDLRSGQQVRALAGRLPADAQFARFGSVLTAKDIAPKMLWLRDERPDVWRRTAALLDCKEAVVLHLTGATVTDHAGASATRLYDTAARAWSPSACADLGIDPGLLPRIGPATAIAGTIGREAADRLGLLAGTPVVVGAGDVPATQVGAGATEPGNAHLSLGTSGYWGITLAEPLVDPAGWIGPIAHMDPERWILWLEVATAGGALAWFLRLLGSSAPSHDAIPQLVAEATGDVPLFAPWLSGERVPVFDDDARAAFIGLALHHGLGHLLRSVMEGVAYQLRWAFDYALAYGAPVTEIRCVGGGTMSDAWLQIIADVLERPILAVRDPQDAGARGAAACVRVGLGHEPDFAFARREAALDRTYEPSDAAKDRYSRGYDRFRELYTLLRPGQEPGARSR